MKLTDAEIKHLLADNTLVAKLCDLLASVIAKSIAPHAKRIESLETQLEQRSYQGVWTDGEKYLKENGVTHQGSLWIALNDTTSRPGDDDSWQLAVKRGRNAR